ncbi:HNH endonuclease [Paraburkholderia acidisoli]
MGVENNRQILIDHINMDRLDNRRSNLRSCTQSQNLSNRPLRKIPQDSKASQKGIKNGRRGFFTRGV